MPSPLFEKLTTTPHNHENPQEKFLSLFTSLPLSVLLPKSWYLFLFPLLLLNSATFFIFRVPVWQRLWLLGYSQTHGHSSIVFLFVRVHGRIFLSSLTLPQIRLTLSLVTRSSTVTIRLPCHSFNYESRLYLGTLTVSQSFGTVFTLCETPLKLANPQRSYNLDYSTSRILIPYHHSPFLQHSTHAIQQTLVAFPPTAVNRDSISPKPSPSIPTTLAPA